MKKILSLALLLSVTASVFAVEAEIDGLWYELISKTKEATVIKFKNNVEYKGNVVIPETVEYNGDSFSVTSIGAEAFYYCAGLTSVTIPNSVTSIGNNAFAFCRGLPSVTIPNSVTSMGNGTFHHSDGLTSITISNSVTSIGRQAFEGCSALSSVTIPNSVTSIGVYAFNGCSSLTSVTIPNSVTSIGDIAFSRCSSLTSVTIPNSVTSIGASAFSHCSALTSVTISNSVTVIFVNSFKGCTSLTSVTIPNSVTAIGDHSFEGCRGLTTITIGSGVKTIGEKVFAQCPNLTDVYCHTEAVPRANTDAFLDSYTDYATLHVPTASIEAYKAVEPWAGFKAIVGLDGTTPETPKCATPTIGFDKDGLVFSCETPDADIAYEITNSDIKKGFAENGKVSLTPVYTITYYAMKAGYDNSDVATATIRWRNGAPVFQGFSKVAPGEGAVWGDLNTDGVVDVADIANIIDIMAGK